MIWIDTELELPSNDGFYQICNTPEHETPMIGIAYYDGIGFKYLDIYRPVRFWAHIKKLEKKYGKQIKD